MNNQLNGNMNTSPAPTANIPYPNQDKDPAGNPFYWRYEHQITPEGICIAAVQYVIIHETPCYVTIAPAIRTCLVFNGKAIGGRFSDKVERLYEQYKTSDRGWRRSMRRISKSTSVFSYCHKEKKDALAAMKARWDLRREKLVEAMAICGTITDGFNAMTPLCDVEPPISKNLGHNEVTEQYVWD